ncbi:MAG TPA: hypothetical protein ENN54_06605 [Thermoplasmatales archaeon]|nr:hypothetical protein [Thermoplasmatales archaeon]
MSKILVLAAASVLIAVGFAQAQQPTAVSGESPATVTLQTVQGMTWKQAEYSLSLTEAEGLTAEMQHLQRALDNGYYPEARERVSGLARYGIDVTGLLELLTVLGQEKDGISNSLCLMYGFLSKALVAYPLDMAVGYIAGQLLGSSGLGVFITWIVLSHFALPLRILLPFMVVSPLDGGQGQLVTLGVNGRQVISAGDYVSYLVSGFAGIILHVMVPIQGAPDPTFCLGFALDVRPMP